MALKSPFRQPPPPETPRIDPRIIPLVGDDGSIVLWCRDAEKNGAVEIKIGPGINKTPIRIYARVPLTDDLDALPTPLGKDPNTLRYRVVALVRTGVLPPNSTGVFTRVETPHGEAKLLRENLHKWKARDDLAFNRGISINAPLLMAGDWITFEGLTWYLATPTPRALKRAPFSRSSPSGPQSDTCEFALLLKASWLPHAVKQTWTTVKGNPLDQKRQPEEATPPGSSRRSPLPTTEPPLLKPPAWRTQKRSKPDNSR